MCWWGKSTQNEGKSVKTVEAAISGNNQEGPVVVSVDHLGPLK